MDTFSLRNVSRGTAGLETLKNGGLIGGVGANTRSISAGKGDRRHELLVNLE